MHIKADIFHLEFCHPTEIFCNTVLLLAMQLTRFWATEERNNLSDEKLKRGSEETVFIPVRQETGDSSASVCVFIQVLFIWQPFPGQCNSTVCHFKQGTTLMFTHKWQQQGRRHNRASMMVYDLQDIRLTVMEIWLETLCPLPCTLRRKTYF